MTGIFEGKLGTKRFCSSRDWGYYCEYIKRPGDIQVGLELLYFSYLVQQILISLIYQRNKVVNFLVYQPENIELQNLIYSQESYNFMKSFPL